MDTEQVFLISWIGFLAYELFRNLLQEPTTRITHETYNDCTFNCYHGEDDDDDDDFDADDDDDDDDPATSAPTPTPDFVPLPPNPSRAPGSPRREGSPSAPTLNHDLLQILQKRNRYDAN